MLFCDREKRNEIKIKQKFKVGVKIQNRFFIKKKHDLVLINIKKIE